LSIVSLSTPTLILLSHFMEQEQLLRMISMLACAFLYWFEDIFNVIYFWVIGVRWTTGN